MKKREVRKLTLSRETVRELVSDRLERAKGGTAESGPCQNTGYATCGDGSASSCVISCLAACGI